MSTHDHSASSHTRKHSKHVTFDVVHRSQRDPLICDHEAPQTLLVLRLPKSAVTVSAQQAHDVTTPDSVPTDMLESRAQLPVGMLNLAAHGFQEPFCTEENYLDLSDSDCEELEDDFINLAGGMQQNSESDDNSSLDEIWEEHTLADGVHTSCVAAHDTRSQHSVTSHGVLSTCSMTRLNDQFDQLLLSEYADDQIGALDHHQMAGVCSAPIGAQCDDWEGGDELEEDDEWLDPNSERVLALAEGFTCLRDRLAVPAAEDLLERGVERRQNSEITRRMYAHSCTQGEVSERLEITRPRTEDRLDCESVLSRRSQAAGSARRRPLCLDTAPIYLDTQGRARSCRPLTRKALLCHDRQMAVPSGSGSDETVDRSECLTVASRLSMLSVRPPNQTSEERRQRKAELKALKRERLAERRANRELTAIIRQRHLQSVSDKKRSRQLIVYS